MSSPNSFFNGFMPDITPISEVSRREARNVLQSSDTDASNNTDGNVHVSATELDESSTQTRNDLSLTSIQLVFAKWFGDTEAVNRLEAEQSQLVRQAQVQDFLKEHYDVIAAKDGDATTMTRQDIRITSQVAPPGWRITPDDLGPTDPTYPELPDSLERSDITAAFGGNPIVNQLTGLKAEYTADDLDAAVQRTQQLANNPFTSFIFSVFFQVDLNKQLESLQFLQTNFDTLKGADTNGGDTNTLDLADIDQAYPEFVIS